MLDKSKLLLEIEKFSGQLFADYSEEFLIAKKIWDKISQDSDFLRKLKETEMPLALPSWSENLNINYSINRIENYSIFSCDGSQIYPDRHQGTSCFLINIGTVKIDYGKNSKVKFDSFPFLFAQDDDNSIELVDCKRQEYEFQFGFNLMAEHNRITPKEPTLFLFDGSLIFWHLESKSSSLGQEYLGKYLGMLHQFYKNKLLIAGYISLPKSKELVNLIRAEIYLSSKETKIDNLLDLHVGDFFLNKFCRTILFKNHSPITESYPSHLHPYFFYMHIGAEIVRIEIPAWIAQNKDCVELISGIILDQCIKGYGFPVVLAEAHEQAVIKSIDRDYFYNLLNKMNIQNNKRVFMSQKSLKKKFMNI